MISSVQANDHHQVATAPPAGNPGVDKTVLDNQQYELAQLIKELQKDGPNPKLLAEIKQKMSDVSAALQKYVTDEKAAHGGGLDQETAEAVQSIEADLATMSIDLNDPNPNIDAISRSDQDLGYQITQLDDK